jgi:multidrug resistance efflux pump
MSDLDGLNLSPEEEAARLKRKEWIDFLQSRVDQLQAELAALKVELEEFDVRIKAEQDWDKQLALQHEAITRGDRLLELSAAIQEAQDELLGAIGMDGPTE